VFDRWCWLGSVRTLDAALTLASEAERTFEVDAYRITRQAVARGQEGLLRIESLP
jgi:hypothetical protein